VTARRWNLACFATHLVFAKQRMTLRTSPAGAFIYGERRSPRRTARESHLLEQRPTLADPRSARRLPTLASSHSQFAGNLKDGADAVAEINNVCAWLMDPTACPTTWPTLIAIRDQNPLYGSPDVQPVVA
jgi:hypothetical protein